MSRAQHGKDIAKAAPDFVKALRGVLATQKASALEGRAAAPANLDAVLALKEAVQPAVTKAVGIGANRVATLAGADAGDPNDGLAAVLAYQFATKFTSTTDGQLDDLADDADEDDVAGVFDARSDDAADIAATVISGAINAGAQTWAGDNADSLGDATKTWNADSDTPCPECDIDGETASADDDFSNGAPHGPLHTGCECSVDWDAPDTASDTDDDTRSRKRTPMTESRKRPATADERRAASMSFGDQQSAVYTALFESMQSYANPYPDLWVAQIGSDWVIYECGGDGGWQNFQQAYAIDADGNVTFDGDAVSVEVVTSYVTADDTRAAVTLNLDGRQIAEAFAPVVAQLRATAADAACERCGDVGTVDLGQGDIPCPLCGDDTETASDKPRKARRRQRRDLSSHPERRTYTAKIELRGAAIEDDEVVLRGLPIRFDAPYSVRDYQGVFRETMRPGVADAVLASPELDCRFLLNHDGSPMARTTNGTLTLTATPEGVMSEARVDVRRSDSRDLALAIERGDVSQMSIGFNVDKAGQEWRMGSDGVQERDIFSLSVLDDVSAVTYPCSPTTSIEMAQRMMWGLSSESRERVRRAWDIAKEIREGKMLSQQNGAELMAALEALHEADDVDIPGIVRSLQVIDHALDAGQEGISSVLGRANPDGDPNDLEPSLSAPTGDDDKRARQRQKLKLLRVDDLLVS